MLCSMAPISEFVFKAKSAKNNKGRTAIQDNQKAVLGYTKQEEISNVYDTPSCIVTFQN